MVTQSEIPTQPHNLVRVPALAQTTVIMETAAMTGQKRLRG